MSTKDKDFEAFYEIFKGDRRTSNEFHSDPRMIELFFKFYLKGKTAGWQAASPQNTPLVDTAKLLKVVYELKHYVPTADPYNGEHIHAKWARDIESAVVLLPESELQYVGYVLIWPSPGSGNPYVSSCWTEDLPKDGELLYVKRDVQKKGG